MKKTILAVTICGFMLTNASNTYMTIVSKSNNDYDVAIGYSKVTETSEWTSTGNPVCNNDIETTDIYSGKQATQTTTCSDTETRTIVTKKVYNDGTEEITDSKTETKSIDSVTTQNIFGTHVEPTCQDILLFDPSFRNQDGNYPANPSGQGMTVICDMTTDGGGWTKVGNAENDIHVVESSTWLSTGHFINGNSGSMGVLFFNATNPEAIMFVNHSPNATTGKDDIIVVTRSNATWNWTPANHNNDNSQTSRFYDASAGSWHNLGTTTYASHREVPWENSPFSFTLDNVQNGYGGLYESRLTLGGSFMDANGIGSFYSFYGNDASFNLTGETWKNSGGAASTWMK